MKFQPRLFSDPQLNPATDTGWRRRWFDIIYRHDTPPSRNFDLALELAILASVIVITAGRLSGTTPTASATTIISASTQS